MVLNQKGMLLSNHVARRQLAGDVSTTRVFVSHKTVQKELHLLELQANLLLNLGQPWTKPWPFKHSEF